MYVETVSVYLIELASFHKLKSLLSLNTMLSNQYRTRNKCLSRFGKKPSRRNLLQKRRIKKTVQLTYWDDFNAKK